MNLQELDKDKWLKAVFPEWGTWLNEEIEEEVVGTGTFAMWWLGCTGIWIKSEGNANILIDFWTQTGKRTKKVKEMKKQHQHQRATGCVALQPNLRNAPCVLDPFEIRTVDAVLASHSHGDHIDPYVAAAVMQNCPDSVPFVGPESCIKLWTSWGVPESRCHVMHPGQTIRIKDTEVLALESFDRTMLVTAPQGEILKGQPVADMDKLALNYLVKTPGGSLYNSGDSHYSNYFAKHGNENQIDVALAAFGENPRGMTDKLGASDVLRMAESLNAKVVIPIHHETWTNFMADPKEVTMLWEMKKDRLQYKFKPYIWQVGGKFTWPNDKNNMEFMFDRGFHDVFTIETDLPYTSIL